MKINNIRNLIREASELEGQTLFLYSEIEKFFRLRKLKSEEELEPIYEFTFNYIQHVPELLEMIYLRAQKHGMLENFKPILSAIEDNFLSDNDEDEERLGLISMLDKAYVAHSIMQAIADNYLTVTEKPLLPSTMAKANQLIRTLIGENRASGLDILAISIEKSPIIQKNFADLITNYNSFSISGPDPIWGYDSVNDIAGKRLSTIEAI